MRVCQASAWPEVATFLIKRKWPKIDQGGPWTPLRRQAVQGGSGLARHWFHGRFQASALPLVKLWAVLQGVRLPEGPGSLARHWFRSGSRLPFGPLGGLISCILPRGETSAQNRPRPVAGWADAPLPSPAAQGAPILPGGQWRPGFGRESSGRPGRHPPLDALRFAELSTALPGGERRLGAVHETSGGPSRSHPAQPVALEGSRGLPGQSLATFF